MKKTKLLFIIGGLGVGGKERQLIEIINNLPTEKYEIQLIIKEKIGYYYDLIDKEKCKIHNVNWAGYRLIDHLQAIKYIKQVIQVVNEYKPDFVISFSIEMSYLYVVSRIFFNTKTILVNFTIQDAPIQLNYFFKIKKYFYKYFKYVIANSKAGLEAYNQINNKNRFILYNGFDEKRISKYSKNEARELLNISKSKLVLSCIANLTNRKDHLTLLNAISNLNKKTLSELVCLLVGDGPNKELIKNIITKKGLNNVVFILGRRDDVEDIIKASDSTVLCSYTEGISNSVIESMFSSVPVLATGKGGLTETIVSNYNGFLFNVRDYESLSTAIESLYNNNDSLKQMGENAYKFASERFALEIMIKNFEELINKIGN